MRRQVTGNVVLRRAAMETVAPQKGLGRTCGGMNIYRRRVDALVTIKRYGRCCGLLMYRDGAGGTFHTTVGTGDIKVDIVCACCSGRECDISGIGDVKQIVVGVCDCPIIIIIATRIAVQFHFFAKAISGVACDAGCRSIEKINIFNTFFPTTII